MKVFTALRKRLEPHPALRFALQVLGFYALMLLIYGYVMLTHSPDAPTFLYSGF